MLITRHHNPAPTQAPGWRTQCLTDAQHGAGTFEVWRIVLDAAMAGPWSRHPAHQLIVVVAGSGKLRLASGPYRFSAPCTLAVAPHAEHQFVNLGTQELQLIAVRSIPGACAAVADAPDPVAPASWA